MIFFWFEQVFGISNSGDIPKILSCLQEKKVFSQKLFQEHFSLFFLQNFSPHFSARNESEWWLFELAGNESFWANHQCCTHHRQYLLGSAIFFLFTTYSRTALLYLLQMVLLGFFPTTLCRCGIRERWHVSLGIWAHFIRVSPDWDLWRVT